MAADFRISDLGSLNFHHDWKESFQSEECYCLKYLTTDTITVQYAVSNDLFIQPTIRLYNIETGEITVLYSSPAAYTDEYWIGNVKLSNLPVGRYAFQFFQGDVRAAALFSIHEELEDSILLSYTNHRNEFETVFSQIEYFNFRVEGVFVPAEETNNVESNEFRDQKYVLHQLSASPYDVQTIRFGGRRGAPNPIGSKINRIFSCSTVLIDGEEYVRADGAVTKEFWSPTYPLYPFKLQVEKKASGELIVPIDYKIAISGNVGDIVTEDPIPAADVTVFFGNQKIATLISDYAGYINYLWDVPKDKYEVQTFASGITIPESTSGIDGGLTTIDERMLFQGSRTRIIQFATGEDITSQQYIADGGTDFHLWIVNGVLWANIGSRSYSKAIEAQKTYYVAMICDIENAAMSVFVDSELTNIGDAELWKTPSYISLGTLGRFNFQFSFKGEIYSDLHFDSALTSGEIRQIYNAGHPDMFTFTENLLSKCVAAFLPSGIDIATSPSVGAWSDSRDRSLYLYVNGGVNAVFNKTVRWLAQKDGYYAEYSETEVPYNYHEAVIEGFSNNILMIEGQGSTPLRILSTEDDYLIITEESDSDHTLIDLS